MKKCLLRAIMFLWMLCGTVASTAATTVPMLGMIYQPQQRDMAVPEEFWLTTFNSLKQQGFNTLIIQWTQVGALFETGAEKDWLERRLQEAVKADLKLVIGLYADPNIFSELEMPTNILEPYFLKITEKNKHLAKKWLTLLPQHHIVGWYLPLEIDDRRWRGSSDQEILGKQLLREVRVLSALSQTPVYITSFFKGNAEPTEYKVMLEKIKNITQLHIWIQDGVGTQALSPAETNLYLKNFMTCHDTPASGFVFEIFKQVGSDRQFKADPLPEKVLSKSLSQRAPCQGDSVFFSLRYLFQF